MKLSDRPLSSPYQVVARRPFTQPMDALPSGAAADARSASWARRRRLQFEPANRAGKHRAGVGVFLLYQALEPPGSDRRPPVGPPWDRGRLAALSARGQGAPHRHRTGNWLSAASLITTAEAVERWLMRGGKIGFRLIEPGELSAGAVEKTRTSTEFPPQRPQRCASTNSATTANRATSSERARA